MHALALTHATKTYALPKKPPIIAVNDVSFSVPKGTIHGLLGPNGAGKSTLMSMIAGITRPSTGTISVFGMNVEDRPNDVKQILGVVPQEMVIEMSFTVEEVLYYVGGMYGVSKKERMIRINQVLDDVQLTEKRHEKAKALSGGMKRRLMLAKAIMHKPKLLLLDEPTAGVDVALRQKIWELVRRLHAEGTTILFTTHYLEEAEQLCESITLVNKGVVIKDGNLKEIQREFSKNTIHFTLFQQHVPHLPNVTVVGTECVYPLQNFGDDLARIGAHYGTNLKDVKSEAASLENIFLTLTA